MRLHRIPGLALLKIPCSSEATEEPDSVLSEVFPANPLSITSQRNIDGAHVALTTSPYPKSTTITCPDLEESELVTNIDLMMAIFRHHHINNTGTSPFPIMTWLAHLHQI